MHRIEPPVQAYATERGGELLFAARCPHCQLVSVVAYTRALKRDRRINACCHLVNDYFEPKRGVFFSLQK